MIAMIFQKILFWHEFFRHLNRFMSIINEKSCINNVDCAFNDKVAISIINDSNAFFITTSQILRWLKIFFIVREIRNEFQDLSISTETLTSGFKRK